MNSIVIVNWEDRTFVERTNYSLAKCGYVRTEDYESMGYRTSVWVKDSQQNSDVRTITPAAPVEVVPPLTLEQMVDRMEARLTLCLQEGAVPCSSIRTIARNLILDLQGKTG